MICEVVDTYCFRFLFRKGIWIRLFPPSQANCGCVGFGARRLCEQDFGQNSSLRTKQRQPPLEVRWAFAHESGPPQCRSSSSPIGVCYRSGMTRLQSSSALRVNPPHRRYRLVNLLTSVALFQHIQSLSRDVLVNVQGWEHRQRVIFEIKRKPTRRRSIAMNSPRLTSLRAGQTPPIRLPLLHRLRWYHNGRPAAVRAGQAFQRGAATSQIAIGEGNTLAKPA